jgi:hypothetical protein
MRSVDRLSIALVVTHAVTLSLILLVEAQALSQVAPLTPKSSQPQTGAFNSTKDQQVSISNRWAKSIAGNNTSSATTNEKTANKQHESKQQQALSSRSPNDCSRPCTNAEFGNILNKISLNVDILRDFQKNEALGGQQRPQTSDSTETDSIRPKCLKQLVEMIKRLASGELEMKTLLEFASSTAQINLRSDLSYLRASYAQDKQSTSSAGVAATSSQQPEAATNGGCDSEHSSAAAQAQPEALVEYVLGDEPSLSASETDSKAQFLPKLVASVDQWLDTVERFTLTREWEAVMRVFNGLESILGMFSNVSTKTTGDKVQARKAQKITPDSAGASNKTSGSQPSPPVVSTEDSRHERDNKTGTMGAQSRANSSAAAASTNGADSLLATLDSQLPGQVQTLTGSLNQLFPWHVWPWNNIDLYSTVDTFLNHGIFAFSKTTAGPERRIDYLPQMLDSLFKSLKWDSFPKKCNDWSKMICDLELFYDRLAVAPIQNEPAQPAASGELEKRKELVKKLISNPEDKLTQELVCIMFSSLSMQQFGGKDIDFNNFHQKDDQPKVGPSNQLRWDKQIRKALKLYKLSREALNDDQWMALKRQLNDLWTQMKISDRVIMVGRIIQLLTNCHMPREILESALWKDIYKYKNALNQIGDIVIEELNRSSENGQFTIAQLAIGSKQLETILTKFIKLLPRLLEALTKTLTNELPELVGKFFNEKVAFFKGPCKGHSFGELVPSLSAYHAEIVELERLVCEQLNTKPSITMTQINNLTNEFLAMALNFTNLSGSFQGLPRFWSANGGQPQAVAAGQAAVVAGAQPIATTTTTTILSTTNKQSDQMDAGESNGTTSSIIDELAANPRLAQIVAILQSSALDPPEVHAELPELDWVEAGTSVALFYESIQRLMSYEGLFVVFPEEREFQDEMRTKLDRCKQMFTQFSKRDPIQLAAYTMDTVMPIALRTYQPLDSFHGECISTFRDIFGETDFGSQQQQQQMVSRESRQWQCAVSATNFVSFALDNLIKTFNSMLRNILAQMSRQRDLFKFKQQQQTVGQTTFGSKLDSAVVSSTHGDERNSSNANMTACVLFDGSITTLMDNLPQLVDLALETVLIASTNINQRQTLKETLCSFENTLDPLADGHLLQKQLKLREAVCHLLHESSLAACADVLRADQWASTMRRLNVTWFETSSVSVQPSFRGILSGVHEFLDLFGKVKPSSMSDGLLARVLNFNSYWTGLVNKAVSSFDKYKERRFQVALQILTPIIYDNLPVFQNPEHAERNDTRHALKLAILSAKSIQTYLGRPEPPGGQQQQVQQQPNSTLNSQTQAQMQASRAAALRSRDQMELIETQLRALFDWADRHLIVASESLLRTVAGNITKLELLIQESRGSPAAAWSKFCSSTIDTYLEFDSAMGAEPNKASLPAQAKLAEMGQAREFLCAFEWAKLEARMLFVNSYEAASAGGAAANQTTTITTTALGDEAPLANNLSTPLDSYPTKQLVRVSLTKWGQVLDLIVGSLSSSGVSSGGQPAQPQNGPSSAAKLARMPKFLALSYWQPLQERLPNILPNQYDPTNFLWLWRALERLINSADSAAVSDSSNQTSSSTSAALARIFDQLNCALDTVKGGLTWDNMVNIYQDRQDVLAAHSTLNNGIALASAGANTFLAHKKFQKFLNSFIKPRIGLAAFCDMRDKSKLESIFSFATIDDTIDSASSNEWNAGRKQELDREELVNALDSFQEFICDTNLETLVQNINPISVCYQTISNVAAQNSTVTSHSTNATNSATTVQAATPARSSGGTTAADEHPLAQTMDRFFKLASLAVLDAKLVDSSDARPPILDKDRWDQLRRWWLNQTEAHQGNNGLALTLVRVFQTLDSINSDHVVWRAIFRSFHELSEVSAYLLRAAEMELLSAERNEPGKPSKLTLIKEVAEQMDSAIKQHRSSADNTKDNHTNSTLAGGLTRRSRHQQQQLASTIANIMFPEVSNFITLRTFKQLRYIKSISDYFGTASGAQQMICQSHPVRSSAAQNAKSNNETSSSSQQQEPLFPWAGPPGSSNKFELIGYKLDSNEKLYALLCHYHSSQWLTAMNIVLSGKTSSLTKKVNYMTKYLSLFTKDYEQSEHLQSFIHGQQMENIEAVANKTVSYMIALSQPFRTLTISKISNISWHSIPSLLESIDKHLCVSKHEQQQQQQQQHSNISTHQPQQQPTTIQSGYQLATYEPKKPDIEVIFCKLPSWNITQVYNYFSENIDLQNMISLASQNNHTAKMFGIVPAALHVTNVENGQHQAKQAPTCITPFKIASKWLKIVQELIDEFMSKASKERIRKCLSSNKKSNSAYLQTMRYVKLLNSLLATLNDLTRNNSWPVVRRTWSSISYAILNQSNSAPLMAPSPPPLSPPTTMMTSTTSTTTTTTAPPSLAPGAASSATVDGGNAFPRHVEN